LMVADTAFLSNSPIVLIDELENAGIDKKRALDLLVKKEKIVLVATHDPVLALMGHKRLVIKDGGISKVINTTAKEKKSLVLLREWDAKLLKIRESLRGGERIKGVPFAKGSMQED
ncbi:ABC transporter ATP-binding protein, partial [candidate division NPL-UPA2 bacterium]|nr:ABC transporter ATP-binding protein [candidate division NPL-UPA2 bacterium]